MSRCLAAAGLLLVTAAPLFAQDGPHVESAAGRALQSHLLVTGDWLAPRLADSAVVVLHVAPDPDAYDAGHIPGARFVPLGAILRTTSGLPNEMPPVAALDSIFESLGVGDSGRIVVYGPPLAAARAFVTLDYLGHGERTVLLDGGLERWRSAGRPVSTEAPRPVQARFTPHPHPARIVDAAWVDRHRSSPRVALIDARPQAQFTGAEAGDGVPRPGHIPGARSLFWEELIVAGEGPILRTPEELRARFESAGATAGDLVVTYCRTGMQASVAYFVARYLGYETRLYDGSFIDWSRRAELPVATREDR